MKRYTLSKLLVSIAALLLLSVSFLYVSIGHKNSQLSGFISSVRGALSPLNTVLAKPGQFFTEKKEDIQSLLILLEENKELKKTLFSLENRRAENEQLKQENASLRSTLSIEDQYAEHKEIQGMVTVRIPNAWNQELTINIGNNQGVSGGMVVVANGGLIGTIESTSDSSSQVVLLTNSNQFAKLAVKILVGSEMVYGILSGYDTDSNSFIISQLNSDVEIKADSLVVTSDLAGEVPSNIQLGKVRVVKTNPSTLNREVYVRPSADFSTIYAVTVIGNQ